MFKVGDLIKGTKLGNDIYPTTGEFMTKAEVTEVFNDGEIEIIVVDHEFGEDFEGEFFEVEAKYFELVSSNGVGFTAAPIGAKVPSPKNDYETLIILGQL